MFSITQLFNPAIGEYGQDYATPVGTPIYSPVAGTFATVDNGKTAWGKQAFVHMPTAIGGVVTFAVGHLTSFAAVAGQKIKVGDLIGYSGGAVTDPSSGVSTGPHVETQFYNAQGAPINPKTVFAQFSSWEQAIFSGKGAAAAAPANSGSGNPLDALAALGGIPQAIGSATTSVENFAMRVSFTAIGVVVFIIGIALMVLGDFEHIAQTGADAAAATAKAVAPVAEVAAA